MRKIIIIALGVITLAILGYFALDLSRSEDRKSVV